MRELSLSEIVVWRSSKKRRPSLAPPNLTGFPNPLIVGGKVIVTSFSERKTKAFDLRRGKLLWTFRHNDYGGNFVFKAGSNVIYSNVTGVGSLRIETGEPNWHYFPFEVGAEAAYSGAAVNSGAVYWGDRAGALHSVSLKNGTCNWKRVIGDGGELNSTPVIKNGIIYVSTVDGHVAAVNSRGEVLWTARTPPGSGSALKCVGNSLVLLCGAKVVLVDIKTAGVRELSKFRTTLVHVWKDRIFTQEHRKLPSGEFGFFIVEYGNLRPVAEYRVEDQVLHMASVPSKGLKLCLLSAGQLTFLKGRSLICTFRVNFAKLPDDLVWGVPDFRRSRMYASSACYDLICLNLPIER